MNAAHRQIRIIAIGAGLLCSLCLFGFSFVQNKIWMAVFLGVLLIGLLFLYWIVVRVGMGGWYGLLSVVATAVAFTALISLLEWKIALVLLSMLSGIVIGFLFRWQGIAMSGEIYEKKPFRRMIMMLWVFDAYALQTTLFAFMLFFTFLPFWLVVLLSAALFGWISGMVWQMYFDISLRLFLLWMLFIGLLMSEIVWVIALLPFGYAVSGLVSTWIWYVLQLLLRFHFTKQGILWKKQRIFLIANACLFFIFFLFVFRWI
ncbi:MAG: hypothetical protein ABII02_01480 [Candidatus Magasanikbacteria bacterium]